LRWLARAALTLLVAAAAAWCALALWFDGPASRPAAGALAAAVPAACLALLVRMRPYRRAAGVALALCALILTWWLQIPPRNDRDWLPDVARPAAAQFDGSRVRIENVRNFEYRSDTDFDERWETRELDLEAVRGVDLFLSFWGPTAIAHTIMSWEFGDGSHLAISIETRKERGESYSAVRGFFRQYELYYVVADERDVVRVRTGPRGERMRLYRLRIQPEIARALLRDYLREVDELARHPKWYNALTHNCTTTIRHHVRRVATPNPWSWQVLANGHADEFLYRNGSIDTSLPFDELVRRSDITEAARAAQADPDFSRRIREGLPMPSLAAASDRAGSR
jgi:hypothetical protein